MLGDNTVLTPRERKTRSSACGTLLDFANASLSLAVVNLYPFVVINHNLEYTSFQWVLLNYQIWGCFGDPSVAQLVSEWGCFCVSIPSNFTAGQTSASTILITVVFNPRLITLWSRDGWNCRWHHILTQPDQKSEGREDITYSSPLPGRKISPRSPTRPTLTYHCPELDYMVPLATKEAGDANICHFHSLY